MSRRPDPERKPQLIADIVEYLLPRSLSTLTFRTLADHLEVSTFTLVYHFGTKTQLISEVVEAICTTRRDAFAAADISTESVDAYFDSFRRYWRWSRTPRNRAMQRLEFEASMMEALDPAIPAVTRMALMGWHEVSKRGLRELGVPERHLEAESRAMTGTVFGLHYDLIVLGDERLIDEAFEAALEVYRRHVAGLVGQRV